MKLTFKIVRLFMASGLLASGMMMFLGVNWRVLLGVLFLIWGNNMYLSYIKEPQEVPNANKKAD
jgi:hypothetical protein